MMGLLDFVKFAVICIDAFAWPAFALGYPLVASIKSIETNSDSDSRKLVTYWVLFSLISLFEHAFTEILEWLKFWHYIKLLIICWLTIPRFEGSCYVYNQLICPCLSMDLQTIINWFKKHEFFSEREKLLAEADGNMKANGPETLEKVIAGKSNCQEAGILQKDLKDDHVTEKNVVTAVQQISQTETKSLISAHAEMKEAENPEILPSKQGQKEWTCAICSVTTQSEKTLNLHLEGRRHKAACDELMKAKSQASKGKGPPASVVKNPDLPKKLEPEKFASSRTVCNNVEKEPDQKCSSSTNLSRRARRRAQKSALSKEELPKLDVTNTSKHKTKSEDKVQGLQKNKLGKAKDNLPLWCSICNISCSGAKNLSSHFRGRKHLARAQELSGLA